MLKHCEYCKTKFEGNAKARFCSTTCRVNAHRGKRAGVGFGELIEYLKKCGVTGSEVLDFLKNNFSWFNKHGHKAK